MRSTEDVTVATLFRQHPIEGALCTICPLVLAAGQLVNSYLNGLSLVVSIAFASVLLAFASVVVQYQLARCRRETLTRELPRYGID